ncbi:hypothetical protein QZM72_04135 [Burkholderia sp. AU45388]|nr:hypothetical protein [Burkholderia sp. AU45388]MDN7425526.1 hypothetical protein [Burkholderia sp. AU45388]
MKKTWHGLNRLSRNTATVAQDSHEGDQAAFFRNGGSMPFPEEREPDGYRMVPPEGMPRRTAAERDALSARPLARAMGAARLYVSATPSRRTIDFYLRLGFTVNPSPDPELYALEPEDIHLEGPTA